MKICLRIAISTAVALGVCAPVSADVIPLFEATPITPQVPDLPTPYATENAVVFAESTVSVYCDQDPTDPADVQTVGGGNPIVDNFMTAGNDLASICTGGGGLPAGPVSGTNCFTSGSSSSSHYGKPIEAVFTSNATASLPLVDGWNTETIKLWDFGGVYGNTALELSLPDNCATTTPPLVTSMCAGQSMDIGVISVTNDLENLYVSFEIYEPGWYLAETHVAVGDIPTTKKGNPIPGQFPYACELDGSLQADCVVTIPLGELSGDVDIAAHAAVFELAGDGCSSDTQYASEVLEENQGLLKNLGPVLETRSDPTAVFDPADGAPGADYSFYSLGFGGDLTVGFGYPVFNAPGGNDICVQEITNGRATYPLESADVYGVTDVDTFAASVSSQASGTGLACVDLPGALMTVDGVKFVDTTNPGPHSATADGYDIDWIGACYLYLGEETAWGAACGEDGIEFDGSNWATYFIYNIK